MEKEEVISLSLIIVFMMFLFTGTVYAWVNGPMPLLA